MVPELQINDVVQFNERHKWVGCLGIITEIKYLTDDKGYMIGVPIPQQGVAYIFVLQSDNQVEYVGRSLFELVDKEDSDANI